jgi:hypothetical protein
MAPLRREPYRETPCRPTRNIPAPEATLATVQR